MAGHVLAGRLRAMSVLVTGGAGYIGSVTVERLIGAGEQVVVLDNLSTGHRGAVASEATLVEGDIRDRELLAGVFESHEIDTVMHFAALSIVAESCSDPRRYFENNVVGALNLLGAMLDAGVQQFILSSTAAVYGDPDATPITEAMPARPKNPYGLSKRMIEQALDCYGAAYGLRSLSLRYFNAAGASKNCGEAHDPETHLIPNVLMAAAGAREAIHVFGNDYPTPDGTCVRDYIHVVDLADAHLLAMAHLRRGGKTEIVNLGNTVGHSVLDVIDSVQRITGREAPVVFDQRRAGDADRLVASSEKARQTLEWRPQRAGIDEIIQDAWDWRLEHPNGY